MMPRDLPYSFRQTGFSLIELMVALGIGLVMSLAVFGVLATSEGKKRTMTTANDINQAGNFSTFELDHIIDKAGSGIKTSGYVINGVPAPLFGCKLFASLSSTTLLPLGTISAPFVSLNTTLGGNYTLAPIIIAKNATTPGTSGQPSDALIVMSGAVGYGGIPQPFINDPTAPVLHLAHTVSIRANDLVLIANPPLVDSTACMIEQVNATFLNNNGLGYINVPPITQIVDLPLAGTRYKNPIGSQDLNTYPTLPNGMQPMAMVIGNEVTGNMPSFEIIGVGDNNVLYSYDLLQPIANNPQPLAEGIFELHALYGVATNANVPGDPGIVDQWIDPATAGYDYVTLENGTLAPAAQNLRTIKAIRLGLIMRTSLIEKTSVTAGPLTLFSDLGAPLTYTRTLSAAEQRYRYRVIESTIPIRNAILLN